MVAVNSFSSISLPSQSSHISIVYIVSFFWFLKWKRVHVSVFERFYSYINVEAILNWFGTIWLSIRFLGCVLCFPHWYYHYLKKGMEKSFRNVFVDYGNFILNALLARLQLDILKFWVACWIVVICILKTCDEVVGFREKEDLKRFWCFFFFYRRA